MPLHETERADAEMALVFGVDHPDLLGVAGGAVGFEPGRVRALDIVLDAVQDALGGQFPEEGKVGEFARRHGAELLTAPADRSVRAVPRPPGIIDVVDGVWQPRIRREFVQRPARAAEHRFAGGDGLTEVPSTPTIFWPGLCHFHFCDPLGEVYSDTFQLDAV